MQFVPRKYQNHIIETIVQEPRVAVWAGMGLGKTVSTLTAVKELRKLEAVTGKVLIIAPLRVAATTWPTEAKKWDHLKDLRISVIAGKTGKARTAALEADADIYTCNYEQIPFIVETLGDDWPFWMIVADESTRLKGFRLRQGGVRARALAKVAHKTARFVELTGTPSPNGLIDLWGQMWFLDQGKRLGRSFEAFKNRWFDFWNVGIGRFAIKMEPRPYAQEQIQSAVRDICVTVDAKDWFDLKDPIVNNVYVQLPPKAKKLYEELRREMYARLENGEGVEAVSAAALTIKCLQVANGAVYTEDDQITFGGSTEIHDAKLDALESIVEEAAGAPILVAYHFRHDAERLMKRFKKARLLDSDPKTIEEWNRGEIPMLLAHPASAGHGLNLQDGGNILVVFGHWWNLEEYQQIIERIGPTRQAQAGHDRPVFIHHIIAQGTVDELVMKRRESKREVQDILLEAMKKEIK